MQLRDLFEQKKWEIKKSNKNTLSLFDKFSARLQLLSEDQQDFVIELTKEYTWIELRNYLEHFFDSLVDLGDNIYQAYDNIFVYPLLQPGKTYSKTKSGGFLHYMFETADYTWLSEKFIPKYSIPYLKNNFNNNNSILLLIDDFIGSGDTAVEVCSEFLKVDTNTGKIQSQNIRVVSIAAQKEGIKRIKDELNIETVASIILSKGITDFYDSPTKEQKVTLMEEIEKILKVQQDYLFGWKKSEALITLLNKSPNNTFPVYWLETKDRVAPFPRTKKFKYGK
jgi:hypothetical protein